MTFIILLSIVGLLLIVIMGSMMYRTFRRMQTAKTLVIATSGSIDEEAYIQIGGIEQWVTIRGEDRNNPVLVILHGGPGQPYSVFTPQLRSWEKDFIVVQWDQRGAGKTFARSGRKAMGKLSLEKLTSDSLELITYIRDRLHKDKVILLASSSGSLVAIPLIKEHPELFNAYVGTDQNVDMHAGNQFSYSLTLQRLDAIGKTKQADQLRKIGSNEAAWSSKSYTKKQQLVMSNDPLMKGIVSKLLVPSIFLSPRHSFREAIAVFTGFEWSQAQLLSEITTYDIRKYDRKFKLPIFIFQGEHDILSPYVIAKDYFDEIEAPQKSFVTINNAGHLAMLTQPEQFRKALIEKVLPTALD